MDSTSGVNRYEFQSAQTCLLIVEGLGRISLFVGNCEFSDEDDSSGCAKLKGKLVQLLTLNCASWKSFCTCCSTKRIYLLWSGLGPSAGWSNLELSKNSRCGLGSRPNACDSGFEIQSHFAAWHTGVGTGESEKSLKECLGEFWPGEAPESEKSALRRVQKLSFRLVLDSFCRSSGAHSFRTRPP